LTDYAIVGDGGAGTTAAYFIRFNDPSARIRIYSEDPNPAYYRAALTNYLVGELREEQIFAVPPDFYTQFNVERVLTRVEGVDPKNQRLTLSGGKSVGYDQLLIATGASANKPGFPGNELSNVMVLRSMQDVRYNLDLIASGELKRGVIVGGGILGLEWVSGLRARDVDVSFVVRGTVFMETILDPTASDLILSRCRHYGVDVRLDDEVAEILGTKDGKFRGVRLKNSGALVEGQLLGWAIGIHPNAAFLQGSGIAVNRGVLVDDHLRASFPNVYAAGDCAEVTDPLLNMTRILGLWEPARHHGRVAGLNMTGASETWTPGVDYNATRAYDLDLAAVGLTLEAPGDDVMVDFPQHGAKVSYKKLIFRSDRLVGALLVGLRRQKVRELGRLYHQLIAKKIDVTPIKDKLFDPFFDLSGWVHSLEGATARGPARGPRVGARASFGSMLGKVTPEGKVGAPPPAAAERQKVSALMRGVEPPPHLAASPAPPPRRAIKRNGAAAPVRHPQGRAMGTVGTLRLDSGHVIKIQDRMKIGSSPDSDLMLSGPRIEAEHAEIKREQENFVLNDLKTSTGTYVNAARIAGPYVLQHQDLLQVGTAQLTFIKQVTAPRAETGPHGLPEESLMIDPDAQGELLGYLQGGGRRYEVRGTEARLGRNAEAEVTVDDPGISHLHCQFSKKGGAVFVRDLGSINGTFINDDLVTVPHRLAEGDVLHVGNSDLAWSSAVPALAPDAVPAVPTPAGSAATGAAPSLKRGVPGEPTPARRKGRAKPKLKPTTEMGDRIEKQKPVKRKPKPKAKAKGKSKLKTGRTAKRKPR
jgi:NADPH-dependent 2,4-dienoyl-CoA reductase/sulfur reductase-like enzyme/pSer/pThr/pTyr-binding forkhead associated (FHA) protein